MICLGLNYYGHNSSCTFVKNGNIIFALEEERISRIKNDGSIPILSVKKGLKYLGITIQDVDLVIAATIPERLIIEKYIKYPFRNFKKRKKLFLEPAAIKNLEKLSNAEKLIKDKLNYKGKIKFINHHYAHQISAHYLSGFNKSCSVVIDGVGEIESTTIAKAIGKEVNLLKKVDFPNSLGMVYTAITDYLGFRPFTSEGTVMALASFGNYNKKIKGQKYTYLSVFKKIIKNSKKNIYEIDTSWFNYPFQRQGWVSKKFLKVFGKKRKFSRIENHYKNIAAALQKRFEDIYIDIINKGYQLTKSTNLTLSGGCALNCKANGLIRERTKFKNIYIQPASHDAGLSIGAAYYGWNYLNKFKNMKKNFKTINHSYFGPEYSDTQIESFLKKKKIKYQSPKNIFKTASKLLADGKIIGWFQGKAEFGPRALGNRSILSATFPEGKKDILNEEIKHREKFRPFAPAIIDKYQKKFYKLSATSPFMLEATYPLKPVIPKLIATLHNDNSARIQTVSKNNNLKFYKIINEFYKITGVPVLLNTSFNDKGEPMVCSPEDAIKSFHSTNLDAVVLGKFLVTVIKK